MRRPTTFLIWLLLVLGAALLIAWGSPVMPSAAQAVTPTLADPVETTASVEPKVPYITIYTNGTWDYVNTPTPIPTSAPSATATASTIPTQEITPVATITPGPTPMVVKTCELKITRTINIRGESGGKPSTLTGPFGQVQVGESYIMGKFYLSPDYLWGQIGPARWIVIYQVSNTEWWANTVAESGDLCPDVPGWPGGLTPPNAVAKIIQTAWGVWTGVGANRDELLQFGQQLKAKGITPAATVYGDSVTANLLYTQGWMVAWRPFTGLNCPVFTEPPEQNAAAWWTDTLAHSQGVKFTTLVVCNEPVFPTLNYAVRWILTIIDLAERDHVARVVPVVWSPGRPELEEVPALALALHSDVISTCLGANLYPAKTGVGLDAFEEWTTYRLLKYPADLPLCVTEFAAGEGGDVPNFAQYPAFVARYEGRLLWATAWYAAMPLGNWTNANLRGKLGELVVVF